jgi:hypothetical protein
MSSVILLFPQQGNGMPCPAMELGWIPQIRRVVNKLKGNGKALEAQACWMAARDYV